MRFDARHGILITLRREPGLTRRDALRVPFRFQVPAMDELSRQVRHRWVTWDTIEAGQGLDDAGSELLEVQVATMLMDDVAAEASEGVEVWGWERDPQAMLAELEWIMGRRRAPATPFRLVLSQPQVWDDPVVNMVAVMTALTPTQPAGETGVERLSVTFLEFPEREVERRRQPRPDEQRRIHDLRRGDTLHEVAKRYYGQPSAWRQIARANGIRGVAPDSEAALARWARRHHKQRLVIPPKEES